MTTTGKFHIAAIIFSFNLGVLLTEWYVDKYTELTVLNLVSAVACFLFIAIHLAEETKVIKRQLKTINDQMKKF